MENKKEYVGIDENRLSHVLGVARECYNIAKRKDFSEEFCKKMFVIGFLHDIGYEFAENKKDHPFVGAEMLNLLQIKDSTVVDAIKYHGKSNGLTTKEKTIEWYILNIADLTVDSKGKKVSVAKRLEDIKKRYGENSRTYKTACKLAAILRLTNSDIK